MATTQENDSIPIFSGEFRHAIDPKNRVIIPSRWRQDKSGEFFVFPNPTKPCLTVMPPAVFGTLGDVPPGKEGVSSEGLRTLIRHLYAKAQQCSPDGQGRLLLPDALCKHAGLKGEIVLAGGRDRFDIWSSANWSRDEESSQSTIVEVARVLGI